MKEDSGEKLAPMASLPANLQAISEEEFRGTLKRGDGLDQPITNDRKAVIKPDKAQMLKKTRVKRVAVESIECQLTSSRVKVEDLVTDEEEQSTSSALETTKSERSFWDQPVGPPNIQWAYNPRMPLEWNEVVASIMIKNQVASLQTVGEVYRQPTADEISEPSNIFVDGTSLKAKSVLWLTMSTVSQPPVQLKTEDTEEAHLRALREQFEPASQACQKRVDIGKNKPHKLSEDDFLQLHQAWQQEFADIVNRTKEELSPWREVNHEINLIDESRQYKYHLPRCPQALQEQLHEKTNRYLNMKW
ncbi:hypothetical protein C0995_014121 [Termitomyces sp. Mi166|nr:hypothetical protein C0995_014121 [Termitomyces sp. Mi166\